MSGFGNLPETFLVPSAKILGYLLNADHADGGSKAKFFFGYGFTADNPDILAAALLSHATAQHWVGEGLTPLGDRKLVFEGDIIAPNGRTPSIRTVWRIVPDGAALFVTAVPLGA